MVKKESLIDSATAKCLTGLMKSTKELEIVRPSAPLNVQPRLLGSGGPVLLRAKKVRTPASVSKRAAKLLSSLSRLLALASVATQNSSTMRL